MEREPLDLSQFSVNLRKHVDPTQPAPLRLMAAKGLVPMAPQEMALVLYQLSYDTDSRVKGAAADSIRDTPPEILQTALSSSMPAGVLDWAAEVFTHDDPVLQMIVMNPQVNDDTVIRVAKSGSAETCDLISDNQVRLLRRPKIIETLYMNPEARMSTVDKIVDLARRNDVSLDGLPALRPLMESKEELLEPVAEVDGEDEADHLFGQFLSESLFDEELQSEVEAETEADVESEETSERYQSRANVLANMRVPEKIRLAILGSREDRNILIRETNRLVFMAAVSSPKATDHEALNWSMNRSLAEGVIEYIANRRDWFRHYQVKLNLVNNPKLPLRTGLRVLPHLYPRDLNNLARNRNVSAQLARQAKLLSSKRQKSRS